MTDFNQLAELILERTKQGRMNWTPSSQSFTYITRLGIGAVSIYYDPSDENIMNNYPIVELSFINERGETYHTLLSYADNDTMYKQLTDIYWNARNAYMKTDETSRSMLEELLKP